MTAEDIRLLALILAGLAFVSVVAAGLLFLLVIRGMKRLNIPPDATFVETLLLTPLPVVLFIDLLDLGLDFLAVPVVWVVLDRLGLRGLRGVAAIEAAIPGTQFLPTLTLAWIGVRLLGR